MLQQSYVHQVNLVRVNVTENSIKLYQKGLIHRCHWPLEWQIGHRAPAIWTFSLIICYNLLILLVVESLLECLHMNNTQLECENWSVRSGTVGVFIIIIG